MKLAEILIAARLRDITEIVNYQCGFRPRKSTTEPFLLRMVQEEHREKGKDLHRMQWPIQGGGRGAPFLKA